MLRRTLTGLALLTLAFGSPPAAGQPAQGPYRERLDRDPGFRLFLEDLQHAVGSGDRAALLRMISYPLRVNDMRRNQSRPIRQNYRTPAALRAHYNQVFTSGVRRAILAQSYAMLWGNWQGYMIGNGAIWFSRSCIDRTCSREGPVRIFVVNPSGAEVSR